MKIKSLYIVFMLSLLLIENTWGQNSLPLDTIGIKMEIIFIDSTSCSIIKNSHSSSKEYFLVLCKNISGKIDNTYKSFLIIRINTTDLELINANKGLFYLYPDMYYDLSSDNKKLNIEGTRCPYLLNEDINHMFIWHPPD